MLISHQFGKLTGFRGRTMSSVFIHWGWQYLSRGLSLLTGPSRRSLSVSRVIYLYPLVLVKIYIWKIRNFGLAYARGTNLTSKSRCTATRFSFSVQTLNF